MLIWYNTFKMKHVYIISTRTVLIPKEQKWENKFGIKEYFELDGDVYSGKSWDKCCRKFKGKSVHHLGMIVYCNMPKVICMTAYICDLT